MLAEASCAFGPGRFFLCPKAVPNREVLHGCLRLSDALRHAVRQVPALPSLRSGQPLVVRPHLARPRADGSPDLVQRGPARRQSGPDRPDGPRPQAEVLRDPDRDGVQGDRGRFPGGLSTGLRVHPPDHRRGPHTRRRGHTGAGAVPARADRAHLRSHRRGPRTPSCTSTTRRPCCSGGWCSVWTRTGSSTSPPAPPAWSASTPTPSRRPRSATSTRRRASPAPSPILRWRSARPSWRSSSPRRTARSSSTCPTRWRCTAPTPTPM